MALAIDASTPALASTASAASVTTASFTPPSGSVIVLLWSCNSTSGADESITSVTNTGTAITWTRRARKNRSTSSDGGVGESGGAEVWTGVGNGGAITVTADNGVSGAGHDKAIQAVVLTAADATALSHIITASSASGLPSATLTSCAAGSYVFAVSSDWAQVGLGTAGTGQTIISEYNNAGQATFHNWRTTSTLASSGSQTMNLTAPAAQDYNLCVIEILDAGSGAVGGGTTSPAQPGRTWLRRFRHRQVQPSAPVAAAPATTQDLPPQPPRDRLFWFARPRPRTAQPPPPPAAVVTTQALPPQPVRRDRFRFPPRVGTAGFTAKTPPPQVTVTVQALPPQPARDRLFPLLRRRPVATQVVVTVRPPVAQPPRDRLFPIPRRRGYVATPLAPVVTVTTQALPPQSTRRLTVPVSRRRGRTSAPVPPQVVIPTGPQALPPQPGRRRWGFLPRARARQSQPVPAQVVIVTGPQALPVQPQRDRIVPFPRRRQTSTQPVRVTVQVTTQALPPQPFRDRLVPVPFRRGRARNVVPPQVVVVTTQDLPRQPGRRRLRFLPRPRRGFATQLFRVYVVNPNDGTPVPNPGLVLTSPVAAMTVTTPVPGLTITRTDTAITLTVPAARLEIALATFFTGDTSPDLTGTCTSNGVAANITGATLALHLKKPDGTIVTKTGTIVSGPAGTWSYSWLAGDLDQTGTWWVEVQVTYSGGRIQTFGPSNFAVVEQFA